MLSNFITKHSLTNNFSDTVKKFYIPLAHKLAHEYQQSEQQHRSTFFVGINGCQGSGKSTLAEFLALYLKELFNLSVVVLSLDDFYLDKQQRQQVAQQYHPLFKTRGVPGTHDVKLLKTVLTKLKDINKVQGSVAVPHFDKALDRPLPQKNWSTVTSGVDIVLFEGWCWGVSAQGVDDLILPVNDLEAQYDQQGVWRRQVNYSLQHYYQPLYEMMDTWLMLKAPSFNVVYQWRLEQEQKLARAYLAKKGGSNSIMSSEQVYEFIQYFQRLTEYSFKELPDKVNILFELDASREIIASSDLY